MEFEIGKIYKHRCFHNFGLLVYPTREIAVKAGQLVMSVPERPLEMWSASAVSWSGAAKWWSNHLNCQIYFCFPESQFMVIGKPEKIANHLFINILCVKYFGWIIYKESWSSWIHFERIL
jgi:hypothetical protein